VLNETVVVLATRPVSVDNFASLAECILRASLVAMTSPYEVIVSSMLALGVLIIVLALKVEGPQRAALEIESEPTRRRKAS
jgi:hypothetical protein